MASIFYLPLLSLLLFFSLPSSSINHASSAALPEVQQACKATRYPQTCENSLNQSNLLPPNPTPLQIIQSSIQVSAQTLKTAQSLVQTIQNSSEGNFNITNTAKNCLEALGFSEYRINATAEALPRGRIKDARIWMSAGLAYQYNCWSGLNKYVSASKMVNETMLFMNSSIGLSSNALSMMLAYDVFGNETGSWVAPRTERDGFWAGVSGSGDILFTGGLPAILLPNVSVCKCDSCNYYTVQEAVDAAPGDGWRYVIWIKEGVYEETVRVPLDKKNVVFMGDGMGKTVITGSLNVGQPGMSTYKSATVGVLGDGFMATGLTIENTAGPDAQQAVAFVSDSDLSIIENCEFLGNQDTLYAHSLRQFYKSCRIEGNVDFIFGNSASIFQDCQILIRPRQLDPEKGENNAVTAHGRTDPAQSTGLVFHNCTINGTEKYMELYNSNPKVHKNYLGRPWKEFCRTVFINCVMEALIASEGYMPWNGDFALSTLYYGEFGNSGTGANSSQRVTWSSQIPADHVNAYSVQNFIQGDEWISKDFS